MTLSFGKVNGLTTEEQCQLHKLADVYQYHQSRNAVKHKYYEGHVTLNDVNLWHRLAGRPAQAGGRL